MQLAGKGKVRLRDAAKKYVLQIADIMKLTGFDAYDSTKVRPPKSGTVVSQLLQHTAGFGYIFSP